MNRDDIIRAAREYLGAQWRHQGRSAISGIDCAGLIVAVGADLGALPDDMPLPDYARIPDGNTLLQLCNKHLIRRYTIAPGSVLLLRVKNDPQHLAIVTSETTMVHSLMGHSVLEQTIDSNWLKRIVAIYDFRDIDENVEANHG